MIYLKSGPRTMIILEPGNIKKLKDGQTIGTPDEITLVAYTPDAVWLGQEIMNTVEATGELTIEALDELLKKGLERPEVLERPFVEPIIWTGDKKVH